MNEISVHFTALNRECCETTQEARERKRKGEKEIQERDLASLMLFTKNVFKILQTSVMLCAVCYVLYI